MSPHNWIHLLLFFCHQHAALHGCLFKICSKLQPYLRPYRSKDVKDLKNYFHPQMLFGGLDLEEKINVHTTYKWNNQLWAFIILSLLGKNVKILCSLDWKFPDFNFFYINSNPYFWHPVPLLVCTLGWDKVMWHCDTHTNGNNHFFWG